MRTLKREQAERIWYMMCESKELQTILAHEGIDRNISEPGTTTFREAAAMSRDPDFWTVRPGQKPKKPVSAEKRQRAVGMFLMEVYRGIRFGR